MISTEPPSDEILKPGDIIRSPGGAYHYRVSGPVCRLYDREELPYLCCRLAWRSKEPSWNRIGCRLVVDMATKRSPVYAVTLEGSDEIIHLALYWQPLPAAMKAWWYTPRSEKVCSWNYEQSPVKEYASI